MAKEIGSEQLADIFNQLGVVSQILHDQLQLVVDENQQGGDLVSNTLSDVLADDSVPREVKETLLPAFMRMQNKDIMHQQLTGVQLAFRLVLRQLKVASLAFERGRVDAPDIEKLLSQIYDSYVMQRQRDVHRRALGQEPEDNELESGLDFF